MIKFIILSYTLMLSACGFKPLYSTYNITKNHNDDLYAIKIESINSIFGAELYRSLSEYFPLKDSIKYLLKVQLSYTSRPQAIQKNSNVFREIIEQHTNYQLLEINSGKVLTTGSFNLNSSYNTSFSPYASHIESLQANKDLAKYAAIQIRHRLILYFQSAR